MQSFQNFLTVKSNHNFLLNEKIEFEREEEHSQSEDYDEDILL